MKRKHRALASTTLMRPRPKMTRTPRGWLGTTLRLLSLRCRTIGYRHNLRHRFWLGTALWLRPTAALWLKLRIPPPWLRLRTSPLPLPARESTSQLKSSLST